MTNPVSAKLFPGTDRSPPSSDAALGTKDQRPPMAQELLCLPYPGKFTSSGRSTATCHPHAALGEAAVRCFSSHRGATRLRLYGACQHDCTGACSHHLGFHTLPKDTQNHENSRQERWNKSPDEATACWSPSAISHHCFSR